MDIKIENKDNRLLCRMFTDTGQQVCVCGISIDRTLNEWNITEWYTEKGFKHQGLGKVTMQKALYVCREQYGMPNDILYTWNGANAYVMDWLEENFDAECTCPIAVQKNQCDDDWSSHIYRLNKEKVFLFFGC